MKGRVWSSMIPAVLLAVMSVSIAVPAGAADYSFPPAVTVDGQSLKLNGQGIRKKLIISVYAAALYTATPSADPKSLIGADEPKRIVMHFLYKVGPDSINEAWRTGFAANSGAALPALRSRLDRFIALFTEEMRKGETIVLTYTPAGGTRVEVKGVDKGSIEGADFIKALAAVWLGDSPADAGLKKGLLGGK